MRRLVFGFLFLLVVALPLSAKADSFLYTLVWNYVPSNPQIAHPELVGTYTFTVDHLLTEFSCIYTPGTPVPAAGCNVASVSNLTLPAGSQVHMLGFGYLPYFYGNQQVSVLYNVELSIPGFGIGSTIIQDHGDPFYFLADYGSQGSISMQITPLSDTPSVPEPSTLVLLGTGALGALSGLRRRSSSL